MGMPGPTADTKTVLCFGDSNTWGYVAVTGERWPFEERWPGVLDRALGAGYRVVEEGLNGRTAGCDDPAVPYRNGFAYLGPCLSSHRPIDALAIMLGTNDLKARLGQSTSEITRSLSHLLDVVEGGAPVAFGPPRPFGRGGPPQVLLVAPPGIHEKAAIPALSERCADRLAELQEAVKALARTRGVHFLSPIGVDGVSEEDGVHLTREGQSELGLSVAVAVKQMRLGG